MKHWKRILSALLIGAMALTLFAGCDKKVKVEDELINQMADYCSTIGLTVFDKGIIINHNKNRANLH